MDNKETAKAKVETFSHTRPDGSTIRVTVPPSYNPDDLRFSVRSIDPAGNCDDLTLDSFVGPALGPDAYAAIEGLAVGETVEISGDRITRTA